jgi:RNA polymerase sigma-70 factor (ECF subfamily)
LRRAHQRRLLRQIVASLDDPLQTDEGALAHDVADPSPTPASVAQTWEQRERLAATLQLLDSQDREMIVLRDVQGYAYEEIATMLHVRLGTVKSRLNRARLRLRGLLNGRLE